MGRLIEVTKADIWHGKRNVSNSCPVALAVERVLDKGIVYVDGESIAVTDGLYGYVYYDAPRSVIRFVSKFDNKGRKAVKPFRFILKGKN